MQLDKLYPTASTGNIDTTAAITSITDERIKTDFFDPYFMGYLTPENAPINIRPNKYTLGDGIDITPVDANIAWGYLVGVNDRYYDRAIYRTDGSNITRYSSSPGTQHLINAVEMAKVSLAANIEINVTVLFIMNDYYVPGVGLDQLVWGGRHAGSVQGLTLTFSINDFLSMYKNGGTFINDTVRDTSTSSPVYNINFPLNIDFNDMPKDGTRTLHIPFPEHGCVLLVQINGYTISDDTVIASNGATSYANIKPFSAYGFDSNKITIIPGRLERNDIRFTFNKSTLQTSNLTSHSDSYFPYTPIDDIDGYLMGAFDIHLPSDVFAPADETHNVIFGNTFTCGGVGGMGRTSVTFRMDSVLGIDDIYKYLLLFHKNSTSPSDSYDTDDIVTIFDATDTPTLDTISGSLSEIITRLRPWQIPGVDITTNDFTPEDIPDPESDKSEESGDKIDFIMRSFSGASNFITNYAMTRQQVGIFGNRLWTSWADSLGNPTEMIKNIRIFYTGGDTGSIDIGSVMPFIVSMKIFPFDLSNFIGYETNGIKIGTGHYPIDVPGCWYLPRSSVYVSCGTVTIPRIFNDFRDYENMNIMCYVPYCGTVELNPGDVIGRTLSCTYGVDLQSGGCTAYIIVDNNYPVATISGQMGSSVPLTATNSGQLMSQRLSDISGASALIGNTTMQVQRESERPHPKQANMDSAIVGAVLQAADSVPQRFRRSAISCPTMSAGNGLDAFAQPPTPYIQMRYGIYDLPANYKHSIGRISTKSNKLSEYKDTGFITCSNVDTSPLTCHNDEKAAIKAALESGVYI